MQMNLSKVLLDNFMPYAVRVIKSRAIPEIDGLKKVQRRVLYSMKKVGGPIGSAPIKSLKVNGVCTEIHPHGDSSIYEALVRMVDTNETLNVPYIKGESNFGKVYSDNMPPADARYTKSSLHPICEYVFNGLDEDGVDIIPNYDGTTTEPALLPVAFPTVMINSMSGIAVGMAQEIPTYGLVGACKSIIGLINGSITSVEQFADVLGVPQFPYGGNVNASRKELINLASTGKGSLQLTGDYEVNGNIIRIYSLSYQGKIENFISAIQKEAKGIFSDVKSVKDLTGEKGFMIEVQAKRGADMDKLVQKLLRHTCLANKVSYQTIIILDDKPRALSIYELAQEWLKFREKTVRRVYQYRYEKEKHRFELLDIWNKIRAKSSIQEVSRHIASCQTDSAAKNYLYETFDATKEQIDYFLNLKILTIEREQKEMQKMAMAEDTMLFYKDKLDSETEILKDIAEELERILDEYGDKFNSKTKSGDTLEFMKKPAKEIFVDDSEYFINISDDFSYKKGRSSQSIDFDSDAEQRVLQLHGTDSIYLFFEKGIRIVQVSDLPDTRGAAKDFRLLGFNESELGKLLMVREKSELESGVNVVYSDGNVVHLPYEVLMKRGLQNKEIYNSRGILRINTFSKFFLITNKKRAYYLDINLRKALQPYKKFTIKCGKLTKDEELFGIQPIKNVPNLNGVNLDKYSTGFISIEDPLW